MNIPLIIKTKMLKVPTILLCLSILPQIFGKYCLVTHFDQVPNATRNCNNITIQNLTVPGGKTLKLNLTDGTTLTFKGKTIFEFYPWYGPLVTINGTGVTIQGDDDHVFDGNGGLYWDGLGDWGLKKPQFFTIETTDSLVRNINAINTPKDLLQITNSFNTTYTNWFYNNSAGDKSANPDGKFALNTDAFDVWNSTNIVIKDSVVYNQDDCVAVRCGSNITAHNLLCYGSHGLSISVGFSNDTVPENPANTLKNVYFYNSALIGGDWAIHIKTHNEAGFGLLENVVYENIFISGSENYGILIEENYPNHGKPRNNVPIKNLLMKNIYGDVKPNATAVSIVCADGGCENWYWSDVKLKGSNKPNSCNFKPNGTSVCD